MANNDTSDIRSISIDLIDEPEHAMRRDIDRDALHELADDIKRNGLINPITVRPTGDRYQVVAGHRRLLACGIARLFHVPCVVRELTEDQVFGIMTAENIARSDVNAADEGEHFAAMMDRSGASIRAIAEQIGRGVAYVESRVQLARADEYLREAVRHGALKLGVAVALMEIDDPAMRERWSKVAVLNHSTQRDVDYWVTQYKMDLLPTEQELTAPPPVVRFTCALSGEQVVASATQTVIIGVEHMHAFHAFAVAYREDLAAGTVSLQGDGS